MPAASETALWSDTLKITKAKVFEIKEGPILMATRLDVDIEGGSFHSILYEGRNNTGDRRSRRAVLLDKMTQDFRRRLKEALDD